jgi:uncharacterized protein
MHLEHIHRSRAITLLHQYAPDKASLEHVLNHSQRVSAHCLFLTQSLSGFDRNFLETAALLHDIGRFIHPPKSPQAILHGLAGGKILRQEGLPRHARVAECHIGIGISRQDILDQGLPLPFQDFLPETPEEMIITYADNLDVHGLKDEAFVEARFARELGNSHLKRVKDFHKKIHELLCQEHG